MRVCRACNSIEQKKESESSPWPSLGIPTGSIVEMILLKDLKNLKQDKLSPYLVIPLRYSLQHKIGLGHLFQDLFEVHNLLYLNKKR
jgi:hypothetical protein